MNRDCCTGTVASSCRKYTTEKGFSLTEMLISLGIVFVVLTMAFPSYTSFLSKYQVATDHHKLRSLLSLARMTAAVGGNDVIICPWNGIDACSGYSSRGTAVWDKGAIVFSDKNLNRTLEVSVDRILKVSRFSPQNIITWNRGEMVTYESDGSVRGGSNGTFTITQGSHVLELVISLTGRVRQGS